MKLILGASSIANVSKHAIQPSFWWSLFDTIRWKYCGQYFRGKISCSTCKFISSSLCNLFVLHCFELKISNLYVMPCSALCMGSKYWNILFWIFSCSHPFLFSVFCLVFLQSVDISTLNHSHKLPENCSFNLLQVFVLHFIKVKFIYLYSLVNFSYFYILFIFHLFLYSILLSGIALYNVYTDFASLTLV